MAPSLVIESLFNAQEHLTQIRILEMTGTFGGILFFISLLVSFVSIDRALANSCEAILLKIASSGKVPQLISIAERPRDKIEPLEIQFDQDLSRRFFANEDSLVHFVQKTPRSISITFSRQSLDIGQGMVLKLASKFLDISIDIAGDSSAGFSFLLVSSFNHNGFYKAQTFSQIKSVKTLETTLNEAIMSARNEIDKAEETAFRKRIIRKEPERPSEDIPVEVEPGQEIVHFPNLNLTKTKISQKRDIEDRPVRDFDTPAWEWTVNEKSWINVWGKPVLIRTVTDSLKTQMEFDFVFSENAESRLTVFVRLSPDYYGQWSVSVSGHSSLVSPILKTQTHIFGEQNMENAVNNLLEEVIVEFGLRAQLEFPVELPPKYNRSEHH